MHQLSFSLNQKQRRTGIFPSKTGRFPTLSRKITCFAHVGFGTLVASVRQQDNPMTNERFLSPKRDREILTRVLSKLTGQNYKITPFECVWCARLRARVRHEGVR